MWRRGETKGLIVLSGRLQNFVAWGGALAYNASGNLSLCSKDCKLRDRPELLHEKKRDYVTVNTLGTGDADLCHLRFCVINVKDG
jgi:hypothetical protein